MTTCAHKTCTDREQGCECDRYAVNRLHKDGYEHIGGFSLGKVVQLYRKLGTSEYLLTDGMIEREYASLDACNEALRTNWEDK